MYINFLIIIILLIITKKYNTTSEYDVCRVTKNGTEYKGKIAETMSGNVCEYWESLGGDKNVKDENFPDGNRRGARNFCRNPDNSPFGPWCFIEGEQKENCSVPLCCNTDDCTSTGPGMEYAGSIHKSSYDNECLHWAATSKLGNIDNVLAEGNIMLAGKSCRNPTGTLAGPWCYVLAGDSSNESWIEEPCSVPTCFNLQFITVITSDTTIKDADQLYTHFTSINSEKEELEFSIKLWNPEDWPDGEIRVALSVLATPVNGQQLRKWDIGYEVILRNIKGGITPNSEEEETWENRPGLINGIEWVKLKLSWSNGFISLTGKEKDKPLFIHEYKQSENGIIAKEGMPIKYISMFGTLAFWNFTQEENFCEEHINTGMHITRFYPLSSESLSKFIDFHVRSNTACRIEFRISPAQKYPQIQLKIEKEEEKISITLYRNENDTEELSSTILTHPLSYWKWTAFSISMSGYRFTMLVTSKKGMETIFDVSNPIFQAIKWYGFASAGTSHWTLFCKPSEDEYEAIPPECSVSKLDMEYEGHQWVTEDGLPCLPWVAKLQSGLENDEFIDGSIAVALNYCRNPAGDPHGAYCLVVNVTMKNSFTIDSCNIRKCKFKDCRIAGASNDFMGQISTTISGKQCQSWGSNEPHVVDKSLLKDELYPERALVTANNFCRDPSKSMGGPWCYTTDPNVEKDLCNVPDCFKPSACTILVKMATNKKVFMVPEWRAHGLPIWIKIWEPSITTTLVIIFFPFETEYTYQLIIGDNNNEKIKLYYVPKKGKKKLLKEKMSQHFLSSGRWVGIVIILKDDEIDIRHEESVEPFFIWKKGAKEKYPNPDVMYFTYEARSKKSEGALGLNFPCDICHTEICQKELSHFSAYYPMNMWLEHSPMQVKNITFYVRGSGEFTVNLFLLPTKERVGVLNIDRGKTEDLMEIQLLQSKDLKTIAAKWKGSPAILQDYWSQIILTINGTNGSLILNGTTFLTWIYPTDPLFYFFNVQCKEKITWIANCQPPQLDGVAVDGGWSPWSSWQCSASCGGGRGTRHRVCNEPKPSMFGKTCEGDSTEIGVCNENECGELSVESINLIRKHLALHAKNLQVYIDEPVEMICNTELLQLIKKESPKSSIHWKKNTIKISEDTKAELFEPDYKITIPSANTTDSGVYACMVTKPGMELQAVDVFSLVVKSKDFTRKCRIGQKLTLHAHSILLNSIYSNLQLSWLLNGQTFKEYDETDLRLINEEIIHPVKWEHAGEWTCIILQTPLRLNWTTNWYKVGVRKRANLAIYLLEEDLLGGKLGDNELVIYVAGAVILLIVLALTVAFTIFILRLIKFFKNTTGGLN